MMEIDGEALRTAVRAAGYTPPVRALPSLMTLLGEVDDDLARNVVTALARLGGAALATARAAIATAGAPLRARLVHVVGQVAAAGNVDAAQALVALLGDGDARTRRAAASVLGRLGAPDAPRAPAIARGEIERALVEAYAREAELPEKRALAEALGKAGGAPARAILSATISDDVELRRRIDTALARLRRDEGGEGRIDPTARPPAPVVVRLRCRAGLEAILVDECDPAWAPRITGAGVVELGRFGGTIDDLYRARTLLAPSLPLPAEPILAGEDVAAALARALASPTATAYFSTWTRGTVRYRVSFAGAGKRRAARYRAIAAASRAAPSLVNDPSARQWEVVVDEKDGAIDVELSPRIDDRRFAYRVADVPAASHPTIAAALARVAGVRDDDVVWDPFVGSATELIERARLGPARSLVGSDLDPRALEPARANLAAAGVRADLLVGDARALVPAERPTLILSNPPMGRRVLRGAELASVLDAALAHFAEVLASDGRIVWISPLPARSRDAARRFGLTIDLAATVDMGGFTAEIQRLRKRR